MPAPENTPNQKTDPLQKAVDILIQRVGERVRAARERKGLSRRVLSESSGVSPRYLAQLEAGAGNISIGLLAKVATALGHRIEWLIAEDDPWMSDVVEATELFRRADNVTRSQVLSLLIPTETEYQKGQRLCLIGLRGAGKSTLGRLVSSDLGIEFKELNTLIERDAGMDIAEIMAMYGQEGFRRLEANALTKLSEQDESIVLAVGGGIVAEPQTFKLLLAHFHTIWLQATPEDHMNRVRAQGDTRPMAGNPEAMAELRSILTSREELYARADVKMNTSGKTIDEAAAQLKTLIQQERFLS